MSEEAKKCPRCGAHAQRITNGWRCSMEGFQFDMEKVALPKTERRYPERGEHGKFVGSLIAPRSAASFVQPKRK